MRQRGHSRRTKPKKQLRPVDLQPTVLPYRKITSFVALQQVLEKSADRQHLFCVLKGRLSLKDIQFYFCSVINFLYYFLMYFHDLFMHFGITRIFSTKSSFLRFSKCFIALRRILYLQYLRLIHPTFSIPFGPRSCSLSPSPSIACRPHRLEHR